jgi:hypothetical protein
VRWLVRPSPISGREPTIQFIEQLPQFPADNDPLAVRLGDDGLPWPAQDDLYVRVLIPELP